MGVQSSLTMCMLNLNFKILGRMMVTHTLRGKSSFTMCRLNLNFKILGEMMVTPQGGQSFLALAHHPNLQLFVSAGFHIGHHRGLSHERQMRCTRF